MHFDVFGDKEVVIPALTDPEIGDNTHTRDPKVLEGKRRMVYGAWKHDEGSQGRGIIL